jgi:hypothetical protein
MEEPNRKKLRREIVLPNFTSSKIEIEDPMRVIPYILIELPSRTKERVLNMLPRCSVSSTEKADPRALIP